MSNNYHHPDDEFEFAIKVKVKPIFVGDWKGLGNIDTLKDKYEKLRINGEFEKLLRDIITEDLVSEDFDCDRPEPFNRLAFEVISAE